MGGKLSAKRQRKKQSRNGVSAFQTHEEEGVYDFSDLTPRGALELDEDEWTSYSDDSSWISEEEEKRYDPQDSTLQFVDEEDVLDFLCDDFKSLRAKMSCGHAVTPMSLTLWCLCLLDEGECKFVCGQTGCDAEWPFEEVCKMALLTPEERDYFERKIFSNAAETFLDVKACPGCQSRLMRADLHDLSVQCPVCTARRRRAYQFCWQCLKKWKGPAPRSDRCGNADCQDPLEILRNCPDITFKDVKGVTGCPSIRACPTCGFLVEHDKKQCKAVYCVRCKWCSTKTDLYTCVAEDMILLI
ncbi:hypothetical protein ABVT39_005635 [Epinephelus coioides]